MIYIGSYVCRKDSYTNKVIGKVVGFFTTDQEASIPTSRVPHDLF